MIGRHIDSFRPKQNQNQPYLPYISYTKFLMASEFILAIALILIKALKYDR